MTKLKPLELNVKDLNHFRATETLLYAKCGITGKELRINCFGAMEIWQNGEYKYQTYDVTDVINVFNEL